MKRLYITGFVMFLALAACHKNTISKIPQITFESLTPDSVKAGSQDTVSITFRYVDGDADLGNRPANDTSYDVYLKDSRYDTGYVGIYLPDIASQAEDATKGMEGVCTIKQLAAFLVPRQDSLHMATGDTLHYEMYIKDRAGHESNHITTTSFIIKP